MGWMGSRKDSPSRRGLRGEGGRAAEVSKALMPSES